MKTVRRTDRDHLHSVPLVEHSTSAALEDVGILTFDTDISPELVVASTRVRSVFTRPREPLLGMPLDGGSARVEQVRLVVDGRPVADVVVADTVLSRARGLLFRRVLPEALLLRPCTSVHGAWMRVPLDVALLSADLLVLHAQVLRPWGMTLPRRGVTQVLEAPAGSFERWGLRTDSRVALGPE
jgi:uncharacterized membrane protein (UPF0127 family)